MSQYDPPFTIPLKFGTGKAGLGQTPVRMEYLIGMDRYKWEENPRGWQQAAETIVLNSQSRIAQFIQTARRAVFTGNVQVHDDYWRHPPTIDAHYQYQFGLESCQVIVHPEAPAAAGETASSLVYATIGYYGDITHPDVGFPVVFRPSSGHIVWQAGPFATKGTLTDLIHIGTSDNVGIALDHQQNVFVACQSNDTGQIKVQKILHGGKKSLWVYTNNSFEANAFNITLSNCALDGSVVLAVNTIGDDDNFHCSILKLDAKGHLVSSISSFPPTNPTNVVVDGLSTTGRGSTLVTGYVNGAPYLDTYEGNFALFAGTFGAFYTKTGSEIYQTNEYFPQISQSGPPDYAPAPHNEHYGTQNATSFASAHDVAGNIYTTVVEQHTELAGTTFTQGLGSSSSGPDPPAYNHQFTGQLGVLANGDTSYLVRVTNGALSKLATYKHADVKLYDTSRTGFCFLKWVEQRGNPGYIGEYSSNTEPRPPTPDGSPYAEPYTYTVWAPGQPDFSASHTINHLQKTDKNGAQKWQKNYGSNPAPMAVIACDNGDYIELLRASPWNHGAKRYKGDGSGKVLWSNDKIYGSEFFAKPPYSSTDLPISPTPQGTP